MHPSTEAIDARITSEALCRIALGHATVTGEPELWLLDLRINARGCHIDRELAAAARTVAHAAAPALNNELAQLTSEAVTSTNQVARLKLWLAQQGCVAGRFGRGLCRSSAGYLAGARHGSAVRRAGLRAATLS